MLLLLIKALPRHTEAAETTEALLRHTKPTTKAVKSAEATKALLGHTEAAKTAEALLRHTEATEALLRHTKATKAAEATKATKALLLLGHKVELLP